MASDILRMAAARQVLGLLRSDELPRIATNALMAGRDSPALCQLAGETSTISTPAELWETFDRALRECAVRRPSRVTARTDLLAQLVTTRAALAPIEATRQIVEGLYYATDAFADDRGVAGDSLGIEALVGLYWDWRDLSEEAAPDVAEYAQLEDAMAAALDHLRSKLSAASPPNGSSPSAA